MSSNIIYKILVDNYTAIVYTYINSNKMKGNQMQRVYMVMMKRYEDGQNFVAGTYGDPKDADKEAKRRQREDDKDEKYHTYSVQEQKVY